jgi:glycosyltransferase involved in cell wall biosynthesis
MKKVAIVGSVGLPAKYGGWETLVDHLTGRLSKSFDFTVYCSAKRYPVKLLAYNGAKLNYISLDANGIQSIIYDLLSMLKAIRYADSIVVLGVSGCIFLPIVKYISGKKFIVNIDGLEWKREKWGRFPKWFLKLSEAVGVRFADTVVADNKAIQDYIRCEYGRESVLIAYGGDQAICPVRNNDILSRYGLTGQPYAFGVCRIEPENNIDLIIRSFASHDKLDLVIVGNWNSSEYGISLRKKYGHLAHMLLLDPIYDQETLNQMRAACHVYIHGHSAGGTNPSLVEAMSQGLPVVVYGCAFNRETTRGQALFFNSLEELLRVLNSLNDTLLAETGLKMKHLADELYTWDKVSSCYAEQQALLVVFSANVCFRLA